MFRFMIWEKQYKKSQVLVFFVVVPEMVIYEEVKGYEEQDKKNRQYFDG